MLVKCCSRYSPLPGQSINGALTFGENLADNRGRAIADKRRNCLSRAKERLSSPAWRASSVLDEL